MFSKQQPSPIVTVCYRIIQTSFTVSTVNFSLPFSLVQCLIVPEGSISAHRHLALGCKNDDFLQKTKQNYCEKNLDTP